VISEYERAKIMERTRRGKLHKMRQGEMITGCRVFGYEYVTKTKDAPPHLKVLDGEAAVVRRLFGWYANDALPIRKIAAKLDDEGVSTVKGGRWSPSTLSFMLRNTAYIGIGHTHKFEAIAPARRNSATAYSKLEKCSSRLRAKDEWIPFPCPPIVDEETFELAQRRLETNKTLSARRTKREYLLRGLVFCPECGRRMQINQSMRYKCLHPGHDAPPEPGGRKCANNASFPVRLRDGQVWDEVVKTLKKPGNLRRHYQRSAGQIIPRATQGGAQLEKKAAHLGEQTRRLNSLFVEGLIDKEEHRSRYKLLADKLHSIQSQLRKNSADQLDEKEMQDMLSSFSKFSETVKSQIKQADFSTRRFIVEQLVKRVILSEKDVTIELSAPLQRSALCPNAHDL
jgi:site-specific DNA recombinase